MSVSRWTWRGYTNWDTVCRRASSRRAYNVARHVRAEWRRTEVARLLVEMGAPRRGVQAELARHLGVSPATISRDRQKLLAEWRASRFRPPGPSRLEQMLDEMAVEQADTPTKRARIRAELDRRVDDLLRAQDRRNEVARGRKRFPRVEPELEATGRRLDLTG